MRRPFPSALVRRLLLFSAVLFALSACAAEPTPAEPGLAPGISLLLEFREVPADPADPALLQDLATALPDSQASLRYVRRLAVGAYLYRVSGLASPDARDAFLHALQQHPAVAHAEYSRRVRPLSPP